MNYNNDYPSPFEFGQFEENETKPRQKRKKQRKHNPLTLLKVGESYTTQNEKDYRSCSRTAYRLKKKGIIIKSRSGIYTRVE